MNKTIEQLQAKKVKNERKLTQARQSKAWPQRSRVWASQTGNEARSSAGNMCWTSVESASRTMQGMTGSTPYPQPLYSGRQRHDESHKSENQEAAPVAERDQRRTIKTAGAKPVRTVAHDKEETEMLRATDKITALYCRLSQEDANEGESFSIGNQERICQG